MCFPLLQVLVDLHAVAAILRLLQLVAHPTVSIILLKLLMLVLLLVVVLVEIDSLEVRLGSTEGHLASVRSCEVLLVVYLRHFARLI